MGRRPFGSPGPCRQSPMRYSEAEETFARARFPDRGKPLPGAQVRLHKYDDDYVVEYHNNPVVTIYRDGTYLLDYGGYPTNMAAIRMREYAPLHWNSSESWIWTVGKREYRQHHRNEERWYGYDNLELIFPCQVFPADIEKNLFYQYYPERFSFQCHLEFVRERLHMDAEGRPVLESLIGDLAPTEWRTVLFKRLQPWAQAMRLSGQSFAQAPANHVAAYLDKWPQQGRDGQLPPTSRTGEHVSQLAMLRRSWIGNKPVASVWVHHRRRNHPQVFRWVIPSTGPTGQSTHLELALKAVDRELAKAGWSTAPPTLSEVLGNLRTEVDYGASLPFDRSGLLYRRVVRAHWMEPWKTVEFSKMAIESGYFDREHRQLPRRPLPGSLPWPGSEEVRVWFELVDGTAVGIVHDSASAKDRLAFSTTRGGGGTDWVAEGVLAAGLVATILAWLV